MRINGAELDKSIHVLKPTSKTTKTKKSTKSETNEVKNWSPVKSVNGWGQPLDPEEYEENMNKQIVRLYKHGRSVIEIASTMYPIRDGLGQDLPNYQKYLDKVEKIINESLKEEGKQTASTVVKNKNKKTDKKNQKKEKK